MNGIQNGQVSFISNLKIIQFDDNICLFQHNTNGGVLISGHLY